MPLICSICSIESVTEGAHVRAKREGGFKSWGDRLFNIVDLCPTCHKLFDRNFITIHPRWRVWIFSNLSHKISSDGELKVINPFKEFPYSFPHNAGALNDIQEDYIRLNNKNEFFKQPYGSFERMMDFLEVRLKHDNLWDYNNDCPIEKKIRYNLESDF